MKAVERDNLHPATCPPLPPKPTPSGACPTPTVSPACAPTALPPTACSSHHRLLLWQAPLLFQLAAQSGPACFLCCCCYRAKGKGKGEGYLQWGHRIVMGGQDGGRTGHTRGKTAAAAWGQGHSSYLTHSLIFDSKTRGFPLLPC